MNTRVAYELGYVAGMLKRAGDGDKKYDEWARRQGITQGGIAR